MNRIADKMLFKKQVIHKSMKKNSQGQLKLYISSWCLNTAELRTQLEPLQTFSQSFVLKNYNSWFGILLKGSFYSELEKNHKLKVIATICAPKIFLW